MVGDCCSVDELEAHALEECGKMGFTLSTMTGKAVKTQEPITDRNGASSSYRNEEIACNVNE